MNRQVAPTVRPVTPGLWPALEDLFGAAGASNGCWCMYWRIGPAYRKRPREQNRAALRGVIEYGPPPGLLAFDGDLAVGWCQLTPRADLAWLDVSKLAARTDAAAGGPGQSHTAAGGPGQSDAAAGGPGQSHTAPVWSLSCFYIRRGYRGQGVQSQLVEAALITAKRANAAALEAYPIDTDVPGSTSNTFTGTASVFRTAGFTTVGTHRYGRLIMRYDLATVR